MGGVVILALIGAAVGFLARKVMEVRMTTAQAVLAGIAGALIAGFVVRFILPAILALIVGAAGAAALIWAVQRFRERRG